MVSDEFPDIETNPLLDSDSYKYSHYLQDPPGCTSKQYYLEAREGGDFDYCVPFGIHAVIRKALGTKLTHDHVDQAGELIDLHGLPFSWASFHSMIREHDGRWPLRIRAAPEGLPLRTGNVLLKLVNLDPKLPWLGGFVETALMRIWYPTSVCTLSHSLRKDIYESLVKSADNPEAEINFKLHDFGSRGSTCREAAGIGGGSHLVNFYGTDTVPGLVFARKYYNEKMAGFSINAAEHGTILSWGPQGEYLAFDNMLNKFAQKGKLVAVVSDTYDLWHAIDVLWGERLRDKVIQSGATVVIRPDSGIPEVVVPEALRRLAAKFGTTTNTKGYKVLNAVRLIQGDGITRESLPRIIEAVLAAGFSMTNVAFGMGGGLLQQVNRDTLRMAMKTCLVRVNGEDIPVRKCPIDAPWKASKAGDIELIDTHVGNSLERYKTVDWRTHPLPVNKPDDSLALETVYDRGLCPLNADFATIRKRALTGVL